MRVAFDIGGTFTDVIALGNDGRLVTAKVLSLLDRVGEDIVATVPKLASDEPVDGFVHATTICSNAVIESNAAPTGLLTTKGFRETLEMRGQKGPPVHDARWDRLRPLVPRKLRLEVNERILGNGKIEQPLDVEQAEEAIRKLVDAKVEAIAVCLINSYLNPSHEKQLGELIRKIAPNLVVCLSAEVHPEFREYERSSTTVINASLIPVVNRYLDQLETHLSRYSRRVLIMQSNGGIMSAQAARERPMYMVESGPAAGVLAAARMASEASLDKVLSFDMGGTTAKVCLIQDGKPLEKPGGEISASATAAVQSGSQGHSLRVPSIDIVEVGAGGGSIAWIDEGILKVGPRSAGAEPGPVCYGRGGTAPTVTDANVVLGYMNPERIAGSTLSINRQAALDAINSQLAMPLKLDVMRAAYGISQVANATMMRALRSVSTERGYDPREFTLVAFGGAGPIHAAPLAESIGITRVVIPIFPGLFSALGLLLADYRRDYIQPIGVNLDHVEPTDIVGRYEEMESKARHEMVAEGVTAEAIRFERGIDLKYSYQVDSLPLAFPIDGDIAGLRKTLAKMFTDAHNVAFGYIGRGTTEVVNLRLRALAQASEMTFSALEKVSEVGREPGLKGASREAHFGPTHGSKQAAILTRSDVVRPHTGPLIIEEPDTTVVVPPGWTVHRGQYGNLVLEKTK
jgi:N-methylhydantoinase A